MSWRTTEQRNKRMILNQWRSTKNTINSFNTKKQEHRHKLWKYLYWNSPKILGAAISGMPINAGLPSSKHAIRYVLFPGHQAYGEGDCGSCIRCKWWCWYFSTFWNLYVSSVFTQVQRAWSGERGICGGLSFSAAGNDRFLFWGMLLLVLAGFSFWGGWLGTGR